MSRLLLNLLAYALVSVGLLFGVATRLDVMAVCCVVAYALRWWAQRRTA